MNKKPIDTKIEDLKCCSNCKKYYDCFKEIVERKMGKGVCEKWKYDLLTYEERL